MSEDEAAILEAHCDAAPTIPLLGCCKWMLAASFRSCFGPCFKRLGHPHGYNSIEDSLDDSEHSISGFSYENGYRSIGASATKPTLDYRSKSTSEIFRSNDYYTTSNGMKPDKRSFSASFGYLDETGVWESYSQDDVRSAVSSATDFRSDVSEGFWSCRGSIGRSSCPTSEQEFYSDDSEEPHQLESDMAAISLSDVGHCTLIAESAPVCGGCGELGKHHNFDDQEKCNWRETSLNSSLPIPKSVKWIQLD